MGYSKGGDSKGKNTSTTVFPGDFLSGFENRYGQGVGLNELLGALPQTQSLFGGGPVGYGQVTSPGGQTATLPGAGGGGGGAGGGGAIPFDVVNSVLQEQYAGGDPRKASAVLAAIQNAAGPNATGITLDQLRAFQNQGTGLGGDARNYITSVLPAQLAQFTQPQQQRFAATGGPDLSSLQIPQTIQRLFGANALQQATPYNFSTIPGITAPTAEAQQMNIAPGGFDAYQGALYNSLYNPVARQVGQEGAIADRRLQAELAQAGLASSGAGVGQVQEQRRQRSEQLLSASQQAADQATQQRFGAEYQQQQFNAQQRQQTALANAGFNLDAQKTNAANILAGDTTKADNYLKTIGLNQQAAQSMRQDFLSLLGVTQQELERLDKSQMDKLGAVLNNWLQQGALLGNLGQRGAQKSSSSGGSGGGLTITGQGSTT